MNGRSMASKNDKPKPPRGYQDVKLILVGCTDFRDEAIRILTELKVSNAEKRVLTEAPRGGQKPIEIARIWDLSSGTDPDEIELVHDAFRRNHRRQDQSHNVVLNNLDLSTFFQGDPGLFLHVCNTLEEAVTICSKFMFEKVFVP
jgi:hypothetical protein